MSEVDNRMAWLRNIDLLVKNPSQMSFTEHEIASECFIPGELNYKGDIIKCRLLTYGTDDRGLYHYIFRLKHSQARKSSVGPATSDGYYFADGILGEIMSLLSLFFQCRFYLISSYALDHENLRNGKIINKFNYIPFDPDLHLNILNRKNFSRNFASEKLEKFLDSLDLLPHESHQQVILAAYHYSKALKEVGTDREMVFIRLVSSIESLSKNLILRKKDNPLDNADFSNLFQGPDTLDEKQKEQLRDILLVDKKGKIHVHKSKLKFKKFILVYSKGYFRRGRPKVVNRKVKILKKDLSRTLDAIYGARSEYLHVGEPMYLSLFSRIKAWDIDPSTGLIIDNRYKPKKLKLPYEYWFEDLVRYCLLNYIKRSTKT